MKISSKIELFVGSGGRDYYTSGFQRLGYLSLDTNERSNYQARELKTVYIDVKGKYIKLIVHKNHPNKLNVYNQVGIVAVNLLGVEEMSIPKNIPSTVIPKSYSNDFSAPSNASPSTGNIKDFAQELNLDPNTAAKLRFLSEVKAQAVVEEDYATAKIIKKIETELRSLGARLAQLDLAKREAVRDEDYDKAEVLKEEVRELRNEIEQKVFPSSSSSSSSSPSSSSSFTAFGPNITCFAFLRSGR